MIDLVQSIALLVVAIAGALNASSLRSLRKELGQHIIEGLRRRWEEKESERSRRQFQQGWAAADIERAFRAKGQKG